MRSPCSHTKNGVFDNRSLEYQPELNIQLIRGELYTPTHANKHTPMQAGAHTHTHTYGGIETLGKWFVMRDKIQTPQLNGSQITF